MRAFAALAVYVSLAGISFCAETQTAVEQSSGWLAARNEGAKVLQMRDYPAALDLLRRSVALARTPAESGISAYELGIALHQAGREKESKQWVEKSLEIRKNTPSEHRKIGRTADSLASIYRNLGDYSGAERIFREGLAEPSNDVESKAIVLQGLADLLREEGRSAESRQLFAEASRLPGISWRRRVDSLIGLADLDRDVRDWKPSIEEWTQASNIAHEHQAGIIEAVVSRGLGQTFLEQGNTARAEPLLRGALTTFETDPAAEGHQLSSTLACLGELYLTEDKLALAEETLQRSIDLNERALGPEHPQVAILLELMGDAAARLHHIEQAREYMERARRVMAARFGENAPTVGAVFTTWGIMEQRSGKPEQAGAAYEKALAIFRPAGPDYENLTVSIMERYAVILKATHHKQAARALQAEVRNFRGR